MSPRHSTSDASQASEVGSIQCRFSTASSRGCRRLAVQVTAQDVQRSAACASRVEPDQRRRGYGYVQELEQQERLVLRDDPGLRRCWWTLAVMAVRGPGRGGSRAAGAGRRTGR